jgi:hypothetical protein
MNLPALKAKLDPRISLSAGAGKRPGKTFGIPRRSVSKIAEAGSTSVFSGIFSAPGDLRLLWVKFNLKGGVLDPAANKWRDKNQICK